MVHMAIKVERQLKQKKKHQSSMWALVLSNRIGRKKKRLFQKKPPKAKNNLPTTKVNLIPNHLEIEILNVSSVWEQVILHPNALTRES